MTHTATEHCRQIFERRTPEQLRTLAHVKRLWVPLKWGMSRSVLNYATSGRRFRNECYATLVMSRPSRMLAVTCHCIFIQRQLESRGFVRQVALMEQRTIGGAGRGCAADRPLR